LNIRIEWSKEEYFLRPKLKPKQETEPKAKPHQKIKIKDENGNSLKRRMIMKILMLI
jgi:hypothetical protein